MVRKSFEFLKNMKMRSTQTLVQMDNFDFGHFDECRFSLFAQCIVRIYDIVICKSEHIILQVVTAL